MTLLWRPGRRRTVLYAAVKCAAFAMLTIAMLRYDFVPTEAARHFADPASHFIHGIVETSWWLLASATVMNVVRTYYEVGYRIRQHRFMLDAIATVLYLGAIFAIFTDVFDIPLKGVLATSGALAIVLGLALQSTLSDLFSGFLINATSPYRVGDLVTLDDFANGEVVEITWRATHIAKVNRDTVIVPNSVIAKSRIVNHSFPPGPHATVAKFDAPTALRPSDVVHALELAMETCVGVAPEPTSTVATKSIGRKTTSYEIAFFMTGQRTETEVLNKFYDAAHRHLESFSVLLESHDAAVGSPVETLEYRLIGAIGVFGMLTERQRVELVASLIRHEYEPDEIMLKAGACSNAITIIAYGIVGASPSEHADSSSDILRLAPREYFGEGGPIAGVTSMVNFVARSYVIAYELPANAVARLLRQRTDVAHALAAKLEAREQKGLALMQTVPEVLDAEHGLRRWLRRCIESVHRKLI
jgi:small-conductance mechanosensitive channel/CRP-like cAMP-binding protein